MHAMFSTGTRLVSRYMFCFDLTGPLLQADPSDGSTAVHDQQPAGFWIGSRWYGYRNWAGDLCSPPSRPDCPPTSPSRATGPRDLEPSIATAGAPDVSPKSKRRRLGRHDARRDLLLENAEAAVDRWESGALSTIKFNLLEATISEGKVPSNPEEFHAHVEDTQARFAGMATLSNADRKASTLKLLHSIQRRDHCSKEKRT